MKHRLATFSIIAALIVVGLGGAALAINPSCPGGTRQTGTVCLSLGTHIAPSSGVSIPDYQTAPDPHTDLRIGLALAGALLAVGVFLVGRGRDPKRLQVASN